MGLQVREDYRSLSGTEKAAILLLSIGEEQTSLLFSQMDDLEILEISQTMAALGKVSPTLIEQLFIEFTEQMSSTNTLVGTHESTERLLASAGINPDRISNIMEEIRGPAGRNMWEKLGNVNEEVLASFLQKEYPQTVAVVLTKINSDHAAKVLGLLPEEFSMEVINRMLKMEAVQRDILEEVERTLRSEFMTNLAKTQRRDAHEVMADIFNNMERVTEGRFMEKLEDTAPDSAERIRSLMFTFEDLSKVDAAGMQALIRAVDKEKLPIALKGATETMRDLFFENMSERASKIMKEDMAAMGPIRLKDVEEAQLSIVNTAKELEAKGEITIAVAGEEDEMIF